MSTWEDGRPGVLRLPSGRLLRGRALRRPAPAGPLPDYGLYLLARQPMPVAWPSTWVRWRDWWLPADRTETFRAFVDLWCRAAHQRVEVACDGGRGRTGTALACIAVLDGLPAADAVGFVRERYHPRAVETPWQRWYVAHFTR